ncbi:hypothetical protein RHGRI_035223 [Rhododendron griersonianum]|uniref:Uncharacterized protein n=1 Tax=Rhododendron griersonianum TaxID=479676 RepID=A0AAV6I3R5_9ERIC|nr:hypothetical protein RHGRI_035223 [Rhododendron griersonianum]
MGFSLLQGKTDHMTDNKKQVQEAKEKVYETAQAAKDWTTETKDQTAIYFSEKTGATKDKASEVAQSAQAEKDKTAGGLGNTAEQVKSAASGTMEAVKQKLGMGTKDDNN